LIHFTHFDTLHILH